MVATGARKVGGRRDQIVAIAMELFATSGSQTVSVREVAEKAGILSGSLYTHFKSKSEMLESGIRPYTERVSSDLRRIAEGDASSREKIRELLHSAFDGMANSRDAAAIMYSEWNYLAGLPELAFLRDFGEEVRGTWLTVLGEAIHDGTLAHDADPEVTFRILREVMAGVARRHRAGSRYSSDLMASYVDRMVFGGLGEAERPLVENGALA